MIIFVIFFFFNDPATTEIYTLSLHDALPIFVEDVRREGRHEHHPDARELGVGADGAADLAAVHARHQDVQDRKSTRLNSSHSQISYAVFCLKKKKKKNINKKNKDTEQQYCSI